MDRSKPVSGSPLHWQEKPLPSVLLEEPVLRANQESPQSTGSLKIPMGLTTLRFAQSPKEVGEPMMDLVRLSSSSGTTSQSGLHITISSTLLSSAEPELFPSSKDFTSEI